MHTEKKRIAVGMSGGTDSTMAAYLLREMGCDVVGITLRLWSEPSTKFSEEHLQRARAVARTLGIAHELIDAREAFAQRIVCPFVESYRRGVTPSPCVHCNILVKFGLMLDIARGLGCGRLATGHYARTQQRSAGRTALLCGLDPTRDQSYFLAGLAQQQLQSACFPLGTMKKKAVRQLAREHGLVPHTLRESQDLCFLPDGDYAAFVERHRGANGFHPGRIVSTGGEVLGTHGGIHRYTIGQRRGLGLGGGPWYVIRIDSSTGTVIVGRRHESLGTCVAVRNMNWILDTPNPGSDFRTEAQLRYNMTAAPATVRVESPERVVIMFDEPVHAITPGQFAVCRDGDTVLGGGWIAGQCAAPYDVH